MGRYSLNRTDEIRETKIDPGYSEEPNNGAYGLVNSKGMERNADILATYNDSWDDFVVTISAGGNLLYSNGSSVSNSSKSGSGLIIPYLYTVQNIENSALNYSNSRYERAINSVYGMANLGWKDMIYADLTARNDWSSTLPAENRSYFYPSASLSFIVSNMINLDKKVDLLKLRGGIAQVGNDTSPYSLYVTYYDAGQWGDAIRLGKPGGLLNPNLLPEEATSYEIGADIRAFNNRLRFDGTWYREDNRNQIWGYHWQDQPASEALKLMQDYLEAGDGNGCLASRR
jgi:outer membrane receptor protein involved in Fe transport